MTNELIVISLFCSLASVLVLPLFQTDTCLAKDQKSQRVQTKPRH